MKFPLLSVTILLCCGGLPAFGAAAEGASSQEQADRLRQLLARVEGEPLVVLATPDARLALDHLTRTAVGRAFNDPQYAPQRREAYRLLEESLGAHPEIIWDALRPHVAGPMALVLTGPKAGASADAPPLKLALVVAVRDQRAIEAVQLGWPQVSPDSDALLGFMELKLYPLDELAAVQAAPEWADRCARMIGEMQLVLRPEAALKALKAMAPQNAKIPSWTKSLTALCVTDIERLELNVLPVDRFFVEEVRCELKPDAQGLLVSLLQSFRADPQPWEALEKTLPGGHDVQLLMQADLKAMKNQFPVLLQYVERTLRGKRWAGLYGDTEDALAVDRFAFLTKPWAGTFGVVAKSGESGETQLTGVAAEPGSKVADRRAKLLAGLGEIGLDFETSVQAPTIGGQAPLAAGFKGRGLMPAPMVGLSDGWIWLCSSTAAYHELVTALAEERHLGKDRKVEPPAVPADQRNIPFPARSAFSLYVNLPNVGPLAYTSWMLGEGGPNLFGMKVPSGLLPAPGFLKRHLVPYHACAVKMDREVRFYARGPAPFGALLPLAAVAGLSDEMRQMQASSPDALRKELDSLLKPGTGAGQGEGR